METWRQTNFLNLLKPRTGMPAAEYPIPIVPRQLWSLLTATQRQQVTRTLVQIGVELIEASKPEARDEPA